jgi:glyoxylase I family protein
VHFPRIKGIAHVELSVSDIDVSAAWYTALLGARETFRAANDAYDIVACALREPVSGVVMAFTRHGRMEGGSFSPRRVGLDHLAFGVADEVELEAWRDHRDELGVAHGEIDDYGYGLAITLRDPDGIALEFICPPRKPPQAG